MKKPLKVPQFKNEDEERNFWSNIELTDYFDASDFQPAVFPNLKPSTKTISLRLPESLLHRLKVMANEQDVPYQSLIKILLNEKVEEKNHRYTTKTSR